MVASLLLAALVVSLAAANGKHLLLDFVHILKHLSDFNEQELALPATDRVENITIEEYPSSLLIPANEVANFTCNALCLSDRPCSLSWVINHTEYIIPTANAVNQTCTSYSNAQFCASLQLDRTTSGKGHLQNLTLTVNASSSVNNTDIFCRYRHSGNGVTSGSNISRATLLVISSKLKSAELDIGIVNDTYVNTFTIYRSSNLTKSEDSFRELHSSHTVLVSTISLARPSNSILQCRVSCPQRQKDRQYQHLSSEE